MNIKRKTIEKDEAFLRQISTPIDFENDKYEDIIEKLKYYCERNKVYALAPVQIGIPKRLIYIKNTSSDMTKNELLEYNENIVYINPIIKSSRGHTRFLEGCDSCRYTKDNETIYYAAVIDRPYQIEIEYYDTSGTKKNKTIEGFEATIFSHEYDHLNGILHMDKSKEIFDMTPDDMKEYRNHHPYEIISKD